MTTLDALDAAYRTPEVDAEAYVLGAAILDQRCITELTDILAPEDFYKPAHEILWRTIIGLDAKGEPTEASSLAMELSRAGNTRAVGGLAVIADLMAVCITPSNAAYYARIVHEQATLRRLDRAGQRITQLAQGEGGSLDEILAAAETELAAVPGLTERGAWSTLADIWSRVNDDIGYIAEHGVGGIEWGWKAVDAALPPLRPGDLAVVLAYSGGGKSITACQMAFHASQYQGYRALVHALEMTRLEVGQRWAAMIHGIDLPRIIRGDLNVGEEASVRESHLLTAYADQLVVDEDPYLSLPALRASIRRHKPDLVVVDQIPLMTPPDPRVSREQQMTALGYGLKVMAKAEGVAIVACAQLNAGPQQRATRTPTIHDIRESKAIGHAANFVIGLHDPTEGEVEHERTGEIDFLVLKARQAACGTAIPLARQFHYGRIEDMGRFR